MRLDQTHYVNYAEQSTVNYGVYLKDNEFYDSNILGKDQAYVASLIDKVWADFQYELCAEFDHWKVVCIEIWINFADIKGLFH